MTNHNKSKEKIREIIEELKYNLSPEELKIVSEELNKNNSESSKRAQEALESLKNPNVETWDILNLYDREAIWILMQKLTCPAPCIGYVDSTGWHQLCQGRAREAMIILGYDAPDVDQIPKK